MKLSTRFWLVARLLLVASLFLSACQSPAPTPTPPPPPTPTPLPSTPPVVVSRTPARGAEFSPNGSIDIIFDQPMDPQSVRSAFQITPPVAGEFSWPQLQMVRFTPHTALDRNKRYDVTISTGAKSASGLALQEPYSFRFSTSGFLEVGQTIPSAGASDVAVESPITVMFNRPVVPLVGSGEQSNLPQPLKLDPPIDGSGRWLNTSIYVFTPKVALNAGTTYTARIDAGLQDATGGLLQEMYTWKFSTGVPMAFPVAPIDGQTDVRLTDVVTMSFTQPMDHPSTEAAFSLTNGAGQATAGTFRWAPAQVETNPDTGKPTGRVLAELMAFIPNSPLAIQEQYTARLAHSAHSVSGTATLKGDVQWKFSTVKRPGIVRTRPGNGESAADPYAPLEIDFASPMDVSTLQPNISMIPAPTQVYTYWNESDKSFVLNFHIQPSTNYTVRLGPDMADPYGNKIGQETVLKYTTGPLEPMVALNVPGQIGTYSVYTSTAVWVYYRNVTRLDLELYRMKYGAFANSQKGQIDLSQWTPDKSDLVRKWSTPVTAPLNRTALIRAPLTEDGAPLSPGLYFVHLASDKTHDDRPLGVVRHILIVTGANLTLKLGMKQALVWATDLGTGKPIPNYPVTLYDGTFTQIATGRTGADGAWQTTLDTTQDLWGNVFAISDQPGSGPTSFTLTGSQWSDGISPWDFNLTNRFYDDPLVVYLYTDRPIYRPNQTVHFKGIVRADDDARYHLPGFGDMQLTLLDPQGKSVLSETVKLNNYGTFEGDFDIADSAAVGYHQIQIQTGQRTYGAGFQVAEYAKPQFQVVVTPDRGQVVQGDTVNVAVDSTYFFGGAVSSAQVKWTVLSADAPFSWTGNGTYEFTDIDWSDPSISFSPNPFGDQIANGEGQTDTRGRFTFPVKASLGKKTISQKFTIEATVTDANQQPVSARTTVVVHQGDFYIGLQPDTYVGQAGTPQKVNIITVDWNQNPKGQVPLTVIAYEHKWYSVQEQNDQGQKVWTWTAQDTPIYTQTVTTDADGKGGFIFIPTKGGTYKVLAAGQDSGGHTVRTSTILWVSSGDYVGWRVDNNDRISLRPDRRDYKPGDTASILIPSPFQGPVTALITVERGKILQHEVLSLESNSTVYHLPITALFAPNVYVSVVLVKGVDVTTPAPQFRLGYAALNVSAEQQVLQLSLMPDKDKVGPRDTVNYTIRATDFAGKPLQAEVSVALVDLSVLSLADPNAPPIVDAFYGTRGLGIRTASGLVVSVDRLNQQASGVRAKGGGGGGGAAIFQVRSQFPDTAFWKADVQTDANGRAAIAVKLPDSLTTWRLDARAVSAEGTLVGQNSVDIVASKPLLIQPITPRFFVVGDKATLGAVVHNNTGADIQAHVSLDTKGVSLTTPAQVTVTVPANGRTRVDWQAVAGDANAVDLTFTVIGGGLSDSSKPPLAQPPEGTLPVYHFISPDTVGTAGELDDAGERMEIVALPPNVDTSQGELTVNVAPLLAAGFQSGLKYLEDYPYDCIEPVVSRFLPNVLTYSALKKLGLSNPDLEAKLPTLVSEALQKLYAKQYPGGGWSWCGIGPADAFVTGYALFGMVKAREAGFTVSDTAIANATDFLGGQVVNPSTLRETWEINQQGFILYVLSQAGSVDPSRVTTLYEQRSKLGNYARALLALTLARTNPKDSRIQTVLSDLANTAVNSATGTHWEEVEADVWNMNTDTRSTAIVLEALARLDPKNALNPNVVRWLMSSRTADRWETTQETAWALLALTDWLAASGELKPDYAWKVVLNGTEIGSGKASADNATMVNTLHVAVKDLLAQGGNRLSLQHSTGAGKMYYAAHLETYQPVESVRADSRGVVVARQYTIVRGDCGNKDQPDCPPVSEAKVGDTIQVKLTIVAPHNLHFLVVEDPFPAGAEAIDTSLKTTSVVGQPPELTRVDRSSPFGGYDGWGWWFFSRNELRDEKLVLFADSLPAGTYEYTYTLHAGLPGEYRVLPPVGYEAYFPEVYGRGDGSLFTIQ